MLSPRRAGRGPLARLVAHVLIAAFVVTLLPAPAQAALPSVPGVRAALPDLPLSDSVPAVLLVGVAIADGAPCAVVVGVLTHSDPINYHRARWMDPRVGRFTGMDRFEGLLSEPRTLHRYLYAADDPVNVTDPSGRFPFNLMAAIVGFKVHQEIGKDFVEQAPLQRLANYFPIFTILGINPNDCVPFAAVCLTKPDLVDTLTADVYEIKPTHLYSVGFVELVAYIGTLDANDPLHRNWTAGVTYRPPPYLFIDWLGGWDVAVAGPVNGVITYEAVSRAALVGASLASLVVLAGNAARAGFAQLGMQIGLRPSFAF